MPLDSDTLGDLIATIRRYVQERLIPNEGKVADEDRIPRRSWTRCAGSGSSA